MKEQKAKINIAVIIGLVILAVSARSEEISENQDVAELKEELPTINWNTTKRFWDDRPTEFDHCPLKQASTQCNSQFTASQSDCQGKLSFHSLLKHFFPNDEITALTNGFISPEKFDCLRFYINTCKGQLEFQATAREDIDLIPNRLRISEANIIFRVIYKLQSLYYAALSFEMDGFVYMEGKKLAINCSKAFDNLPINIIISINQVSLSEFAKLFAVNDFTSLDLPPAVEELKTLTLTSVSIQGFYHIDGYFEFILKGKPDTSTVFQRSYLYLLIQKQVNDEINAGMTAYFAAASFQEIISGIIGKDIFYRIPILWYGKLNIALQTSLNGIAKVKDEDFNKAFRFFVTRGVAISKGLSIRVEFPFQKYATVVSSSIFENNLPLKFLFTGKISQRRISISFDTDLILSLKSVFLVLMSQAEAVKLLAAFKEQRALCRVTRMDVMLSNSEIRVYLTMQDSVDIVQGLPKISQFAISLRKILSSSWKINGHGHGRIANIDFETEMKTTDGKIYSLVAKSETLSSFLLFENIARDTGLIESFKSFEFFNFEIRNILAKSKMNAELNFRLTGIPNIFGDKTSQYIEMILYNNSRSFPGVAFGLILKNVNFEELLVKLFGPTQQRGIWVQSVDCAIVINSENVQGGSIKFKFSFVQLNEVSIKRGFNIGLKFGFPSNCGGDAMCQFLKSHAGSGESSEIFLSGNLSSKELSCEWKKSYIVISTNLQLRDVVFRMSGGKVIHVILSATFQMKQYKFALQGSLVTDQASGMLLEVTMDSQLDNAFSVAGCSLSQLYYKSSIVSLESLEFLEFSGNVHFGVVHPKRRLISTGMITLSILDAQQSYFYSKISSLDIKSVFEAYGVNYQIPMVLQSVVINGDAIASYSNNLLPVIIEDLNLKIENRLTIQGIMSIFGYLGKFKLTLVPSNLLLEIKLPKLDFDDGFVRVVSSCDCSNLEKFDGPTLFANIMSPRVYVMMTGTVKCLGMSRHVNITIDDSGYTFLISGVLYGIFNAEFNLTAAFGKPSEVSFMVAACIPSAMPNVTYEVVQKLKFINSNTKELLYKTKRKVAELEMILHQSHKRMDIHKEQSRVYKDRVEDEIESLTKMRAPLHTPCQHECSKVCMGAPGWSNNALPFDEYFVGSPKWNKCIHDVPDLVCIVQCLGKSVIRNVKAFNMQRKLQKLIELYQHSVEKERQSKRFLQRTVYQVGAVISKLENANERMRVGLNVARALAGRSIPEVVDLDKICMTGYAKEVARSEVEFSVKGSVAGESVNLKIRAKIDEKIWKYLAAEVMDGVFSNSTSFDEAETDVRTMLRDAEAQKRGILKELRDKIYKNDIGETFKKDIVANELEFKRFAYSELPRYTLGNDGIVKLFTKESPWVLIRSNDPLENAFISNGTRRMIPSKVGKNADERKERGSKKTPCESVRDALKKYKDVIAVASAIAENFFEEKISYLKNKNKQFAALRDIEDQIKSECYIENCTVGELNDALKYAGKTKDGLMNWMGSMRDQILKHDRTSLQVLSENIAAIVEKEYNEKLNKYITTLANDLSATYKRSINAKEANLDLSVLEQMDLDVRDLLLNSRGRRLTHAAPLIFSIKRRFHTIYHTMLGDCLNKGARRPELEQTES